MTEPDEDYSDDPVALTSMEAIWREQDRVMATWPDYDQLRTSLVQELNAKVDMESLSRDDLVDLGVLLREKFWDAGGCLSETSYRYGYLARIVLELAHEKFPYDLAVTDELVEAIQSVMVMVHYDPDSDEMVSNEHFAKTLLPLRQTQFVQLLQEIDEGRPMEWDDFKRALDYTWLLPRQAKQFDPAVEVVQWIIDHIQEGELAVYTNILKRFQDALAQKHYFGFNIYNHSDFPQEYRYFRRCITFKGPTSRSIKPVHLVNPNAKWD